MFHVNIGGGTCECDQGKWNIKHDVWNTCNRYGMEAYVCIFFFFAAAAISIDSIADEIRQHRIL